MKCGSSVTATKRAESATPAACSWAAIWWRFRPSGIVRGLGLDGGLEQGLGNGGCRASAVELIGPRLELMTEALEPDGPGKDMGVVD